MARHSTSEQEMMFLYCPVRRITIRSSRTHQLSANIRGVGIKAVGAA